jgi:tyramine---L-glutamate ligase
LQTRPIVAVGADEYNKTPSCSYPASGIEGGIFDGLLPAYRRPSSASLLCEDGFSMPRIFLYEFLTGGGLRGDWLDSKNASLRCEGLAMLSALAADFAAVDGVSTTVILDEIVQASWPGHENCRIVRTSADYGDCEALAAHCRDADWAVVIAPEFDEILQSRLKLVERSGGRLLGPSPALAVLATDKQRTAEHLATAGVPVAVGRILESADLADAAEKIEFPAVVKPLEGCGSQDVWLLHDSQSARRVASELLAAYGPAKRMRIERFYPGVAASVAVLCGSAGLFPLPACSQRLSPGERLRYLGGHCPLEPHLAKRARSLAVRAVRSLDAPIGYLGVDLVLESDPSGRDDVVIEINPRLTTSYVGLRTLAKSNLAAAMLAVAEGNSPELFFADHAVEFDSDGTLTPRCGKSMPATRPPLRRAVPDAHESFPPAAGNRR